MSKKRIAIILAGALGVVMAAALVLPGVLNEARAAPAAAIVDKQVLDIAFDDFSAYPGEGADIGNELVLLKSENVPFSVTSVDVNNGPGEPVDAEISFYAILPAGCEGRWYDPQGAFPFDVQTIGGDINVGSSGTTWFPPVKEPGPVTVDLHFQTAEYGLTEPIGMPQRYTRFFELHCYDTTYDDDQDGSIDEDPWDGIDNDGDCPPGEDSNGNGVFCDCLVTPGVDCDLGVDEDPPGYLFTFCNRADAKFDIDPDPLNNLRCEDLNVVPLHNADIKVLDFYSDPPGPFIFDVSTYNVIDLIEDKHNNGPQDALSSVSWTIDPPEDRDGDTIPDINVRWEAQIGDLCTYGGLPVPCGEGDTAGSGSGLPSLTGDNCQDDIDNDGDGPTGGGCDIDGCPGIPNPDPECQVDIDDIHFTVNLDVSVSQIVQRPLKLHCKTADPLPYTLTLYNDEWPIDPETGDPWEDPDPSNNSIQLDIDVICRAPPEEWHYKCYGIYGHDVYELVDLETQFGVETDAVVEDGKMLCAPAIKNDVEGDLNAPHLKWYHLNSDEDPDVIVNLTTQYGTHTDVEVGQGIGLLVPALKEVTFPYSEPPVGPLQTAPHYKCYRIPWLYNPPDTVDLETQFGVEQGLAVETLLYLCAPALKTYLGPQEGDLSYPHLACYNIHVVDDPPHIVNLETQFGFELDVGVGDHLTFNEVMCVPAIKEIVETNVDKQVLDVRFDQNDNYPNEGTELVPPNDLTVTADTNVTISVTSDDVNNGPGLPTDAEISFFADIPAGCQGRFQDPGGLLTSDVYTVDGDILVGSSGTVISPPVPETGPRWVDVHFQTLDYQLDEPVGIVQSYTRFFELQCQPGDYVFEFCNRADVKPPAVEAAPGDELLCEDLTVHATVPEADYKCYLIEGPPLGFPVLVETQFGTEVVDVQNPQFLCPPALKDGLGDLNQPHLKWYMIFSTEDPDVVVNLTIPQWGIVHEDVEVGPAQILAVPALKAIDPEPPPPPPAPSAPHYKCYDIMGTYDPSNIVDLETQFGPEPAVEVGPLEHLCAPAIKEGEGNLNYNHLACYQIMTDFQGWLVNLTTQFGEEWGVMPGFPIPVGELCVPAIKEIVLGSDKDVLDIDFDDGAAYPLVGTSLPYNSSLAPNGQTMSLVPLSVDPTSNVPFSVTSTDINLGPVEPADAEISFYVDVPAGCDGRWYDPTAAFPADVQTIAGDENVGSSGTTYYPPAKEPGPVRLDLHFQTLAYGDTEPVGVPVDFTRFFEVHCAAEGMYRFDFWNRADVKPPGVDPDPGNNVLGESFWVLTPNAPGCPNTDASAYDGAPIAANWTDCKEQYIGTDYNDDCPDNLADDALPTDVASAGGVGQHDATVNILDVLAFKPKLAPNPYDKRYDLTTDYIVNILDVLLYKPELLKAWPCP